MEQNVLQNHLKYLGISDYNKIVNRLMNMLKEQNLISEKQVDNLLNKEDIYETIMNIFFTLGEKNEKVIVLYLDGKTLFEIGKMFNVSHSAIYVRLRQSLNKIGYMLKGDTNFKLKIRSLLSTRAYHALTWNGIVTKEKFEKLFENNQIKNLEYCGPKTRDEIIKIKNKILENEN